MGYNYRILWVDESDEVHAIPRKRFEDLVLRRDRSAAMPQFAGQRIREALVYVEFRNRRPHRIDAELFHVLLLDASGMPDVEARAIEEQLAVAGWRPAPNEDDPPGVYQFARKRLRDEFQWSPGPQLLERLRSLALR